MITRVTAENYLRFIFIVGAIHNSPSSMFQGKGVDAWTCNNYTKTKNINANKSAMSILSNLNQHCPILFLPNILSELYHHYITFFYLLK